MDFLEKDAVTVKLQKTKKQDVIEELVEILCESHKIKDKDRIIESLMEREGLGSTGIGQGVGIPHAKTSAVTKLIGALGISRNGVDFDSLDGELTHIFFLLVAPEDAAGPHLKALARISRILKEKYFRDSLIVAKSKEEVLDIINKEDQKL